MSEKKNLILYIVILFVAAVIIALSWIALLWKDTSYPYCEMPRVVFSYRNDGNDIYVFDSEGYIYKSVDFLEKRWISLDGINHPVFRRESRRSLVGKSGDNK